jgi:hypothetical protein
MKREPTQEEREKIVRAMATGDRIGATSMYISITECGLTEAQKFIKVLTTELELGNPEKFAKRQQKRPSDSILGFLIQPMLSATQPLPISVCRATLTARFA